MVRTSLWGGFSLVVELSAKVVTVLLLDEKERDLSRVLDFSSIDRFLLDDGSEGNSEGPLEGLVKLIPWLFN